MACTKPRRGYRARALNPSGKRSVVFNAREGYVDMPVDVPCGQCIECRILRSGRWAVRLSHEASLYEQNSFITLTYSDDHLPADGSLDKTHYQLFMKALRQRNSGRLIRTFYCGEYGEQLGRPHFHACIFNYDFPDKVKVEPSPSGEPQWDSEILSSLWKKGRVRIGTLTFESAQYVAKYVVKKKTGKMAESHYQGRTPEFAHGSKGLGVGWFEKFKRDIYPDDFVVVINRHGKAKQVPVPKYYDLLLERLSPEEFIQLKARRKNNALAKQDHSAEGIIEAARRREAREFILTQKFNEFKRS